MWLLAFFDVFLSHFLLVAHNTLLVSWNVVLKVTPLTRLQNQSNILGQIGIVFSWRHQFFDRLDLQWLIFVLFGFSTKCFTRFIVRLVMTFSTRVTGNKSVPFMYFYPSALYKFYCKKHGRLCGKIPGTDLDRSAFANRPVSGIEALKTFWAYNICSQETEFLHNVPLKLIDGFNCYTNRFSHFSFAEVSG